MVPGSFLAARPTWSTRSSRPGTTLKPLRQVSERSSREILSAPPSFESRVGGANVDDIVHWFDEGGALKISLDERSETCLKGFSVVPGLLELVDQVGLAATT